MIRYVAFLRAINVGGHIVKMDALKKSFVRLGFDDVDTFIASGNVLFSSRSKDPAKLANLFKIQTHFTTLFANFLTKLQATPDGDGSLLDHSMTLYGSGMGDSQEHGRTNIPTVLVGWGVDGNRHVKASGTDTLLADALVGVVNEFGIDVNRVGTSKSRGEG